MFFSMGRSSSREFLLSCATKLNCNFFIETDSFKKEIMIIKENTEPVSRPIQVCFFHFPELQVGYLQAWTFIVLDDNKYNTDTVLVISSCNSSFLFQILWGLKDIAPVFGPLLMGQEIRNHSQSSRTFQTTRSCNYP